MRTFLRLAPLLLILSACARDAEPRATISAPSATTPPSASSASAPAPSASVSSTPSAPSASAAVSATPGEAVGDWSPEVEGLAARFVATRTADNVRLVLELRASKPVEVGLGTFGQMLRFDAIDATGASLPFSAVGGNELAALPKWRPFTPGPVARFVVSERAFEHVRPGRTLLRPVTFQAWELGSKTGAGVRLGARLTSAPVDGATPHPYRATLTVPPVTLP